MTQTDVFSSYLSDVLHDIQATLGSMVVSVNNRLDALDAQLGQLEAQALARLGALG
jgi:hypothetical protein